MPIKKESKIFLAGHIGLIGSAIKNLLEYNEYGNILTQKRDQLDLINFNETSSYIKKNKPDYVIIAAGKTGGIQENNNFPFDLMYQNLQLQSSLLNACQNNDVKKVLFFGSSCMYPKDISSDISEDMLLTGKMETSSLSYAISKIAGVQMCLALNKQFKKNSFIPLIPNSVYGPNDNFHPEKGHVLSSLIHKFHEAKKLSQKEITLWGTGKPIREFIFSKDLADACILVLNTDIKKITQPINISSGQEFSILELSHIIAKIIGYKGKIKWDTSKPDGTYKKSLDTKRINKLGWKPKTSIEEGIFLTYKWYLDNLNPSM